MARETQHARDERDGETVDDVELKVPEDISFSGAARQATAHLGKWVRRNAKSKL
jgi:hypothetical protein